MSSYIAYCPIRDDITRFESINEAEEWLLSYYSGHIGEVVDGAYIAKIIKRPVCKIREMPTEYPCLKYPSTSAFCSRCGNKYNGKCSGIEDGLCGWESVMKIEMMEVEE